MIKVGNIRLIEKKKAAKLNEDILKDLQRDVQQVKYQLKMEKEKVKAENLYEKCVLIIFLISMFQNLERNGKLYPKIIKN